MKALRWFLGKLILALDCLFRPAQRKCDPAEQARRQASLAGLELYQFNACPFCVKVRRFLHAEAVELPLRDATRDPGRAELLAGGGKLQVPCLKIPEAGGVRWLYESSDILQFLRGRLENA